MFDHVVMMRFEPEADAALLERVERCADRVRAERDGIEAFFVQPNAADRSDGLTHAAIGVFASSKARDRHQVSPAHREMEAFMMPRIARIAVFDAEVGS